MFERGLRGGITQSIHRWAKANNPYMGSEYTPHEPTRYLQYLDANNLYGWAMSQPLPTRGFKWVDVKLDDVGKLANSREKGYILEVDVFYPRELHDCHDDLPFMCECLWALPVGLNKKVISLMKDELGGEIMYAYKAGGSESKKCKGIKKCVVRAMISFEDYKNCLLSGEASYRSQLMFRSSKYEVKTLEVNKLVLSRDDDKLITVNGINSLARGHHRTIKYNLYI